MRLVFMVFAPAFGTARGGGCRPGRQRKRFILDIDEYRPTHGASLAAPCGDQCPMDGCETTVFRAGASGRLVVLPLARDPRSFIVRGRLASVQYLIDHFYDMLPKLLL